MSRKRLFSISEDERSILYFIWRVKVASTAAIYLRFESDFKWRQFTAYERLLILKKKGCLDTRSDGSGDFRVWTLTTKGFKTIQHKLFALKEDGFGSESVTHDLFVLAAHYGDWLPKEAAPDVRFVTEQELRRIDDADLPKWARPLQMHKPDGAWYFPEAKIKMLYALEVELSRKRQIEYKALGAFYSEEKSISSVLWIVQSKGHARSIVEAFQSTSDAYRNIHNFVLLDEFKNSGWASKIFFGPSAGLSIHNYLAKARHGQGTTTPQPASCRGCVEKILNIHLKRFDSSTSTLTQNSKIRA